MIRVAVLGAAGQMGAAVCRAVASNDGLELAAAVAPRHGGQSLAEITGAGGVDLVVSGDCSGLSNSVVDVAVDFTNATAAPSNLAFCLDEGIHVVCGTTGMDDAVMRALVRRFDEAETPNAVLAANFSISAVLLMRLAEIAAPYLDGVEIVELHHEHKRDAPSGTALETARRIAAARLASGAGAFAGDATTSEVLQGARGGSGPSGIRVHSVRLPGLVAHEEVLFGAPGQALSIRQDSFDRTSFMPGVLLAVQKVATTPGCTIGLESLLEL